MSTLKIQKLVNKIKPATHDENIIDSPENPSEKTLAGTPALNLRTKKDSMTAQQSESR